MRSRLGSHDTQQWLTAHADLADYGPGSSKSHRQVLEFSDQFCHQFQMARTIIFYALGLGLGTTFLNWLQYRYLARVFSTEIYIGLLAAGFTVLGIWVGRRLTPRSYPAEFHRNDAAIQSLGLSPREVEILEALVTGDSNKELARRLGISPNTVKTHVARVYAKLRVDKRVQAIEKARMLAVIR